MSRPEARNVPLPPTRIVSSAGCTESVAGELVQVPGPNGVILHDVVTKRPTTRARLRRLSICPPNTTIANRSQGGVKKVQMETPPG